MPKKPSKAPAAKANEAKPSGAEAPAPKTSDVADAAAGDEEEAVAEPPQRTEGEADRAAADGVEAEASAAGASGGMQVGENDNQPPAAAAAAPGGGEAVARAAAPAAPSSAAIMLLQQADAAADQHLARFYRELGALIEGEARVLAEDWTFLRHCNAMHAARFTDLVSDAEASITAIADVKTQCRELPEYFGQIDELDQSLAVLEVAAVKLDQYSRALERRFGLN